MVCSLHILPPQVPAGENAFISGFVMQFFAGICTQMFQHCSVIHKDFVSCRSFDDAIVLFRGAVLQGTNTKGDDSPVKGRDGTEPIAGSEKEPALEGHDAVPGKDEASNYEDSNEAVSCMEWNFKTARMESVTHVKFRVHRIIQWTNRDERGDRYLCKIYDSSKLDTDNCHQRVVHELDLLPATIAEFENNTKKKSRQKRSMMKMADTATGTGTGKSLPKRKKANGSRSTKKQQGEKSPAVDFTTFQKREEAMAALLNDDDGVVVAVGPYALRDDLANLAKSYDVATATQAGWHEMRESLHFRSVLARQKVLTSQYIRRAMCFGVVGTSAFFSGNIVCFPLHHRSPPVVNHCNIYPGFHNPVLCHLRW